jgi:integrase/recombinase XerD
LLLEQKNKHWMRRVSIWLNDFVSTVDIENIAQVTDYLQKLQEKYHPNTYRKIYFQIRRFLQSQNLTYLDRVRLPRVINSPVKIVTENDIKQAIVYFSKTRNFLKYRAFILLASSSGLRPSEMTQLQTSDIDLDKRTVFVRNDAMHHTKTNCARVSFFDERTQGILKRYIAQRGGKRLFNGSSVGRDFGKAPIRAKDCRKYFSQEFTRRNGNQAVKEILLGHSSNNSVDSMHYLALSEEDLKQIYDKVMN